MRTRIVLFLCAALALTVGVATATAGGNSPNAKLCQKNGWMNYQGSDGTQFTSEEQCVAFAAQGVGSIVPPPPTVDLGLSFVTPSTLPGPSLASPSGDVVLHNYSATGETYSVSIDFHSASWQVKPGAGSSCFNMPTSDGFDHSWLCSGTIAAGASVTLLGLGWTDYTGTASITAAQYGDPVTSNNTVSLIPTG